MPIVTTNSSPAGRSRRVKAPAVSSSSISLALSSATLTVVQASTTTTTVTLTRTSYTGDVTLAVSGLPSGVTGAFGTNPLTGATLTSVLTLTATGGATIVTADAFTVTATGSGVSDATIGATVTVEAPAVSSPFFTETYAGGVQNSTGGFAWDSFAGSLRVSMVTDGDSSSGYALQIVGRPTGSDASDNQSGIDHAFTLPSSMSDLWIEYDFKPPSNYQHRDSGGSNNNKMFVLWDGSYVNTAKLLFDFEMNRSTNQTLTNSTLRPGARGHVDGDNNVRDLPSIDGPFIGGTNGPVVIGQYNQIRYRLSTSSAHGVSDGQFRIWVNGASVYNSGSILLQDPTDAGGRAVVRYGRILSAANSGFVEDTAFRFKNWKFYSTDPGWT